MTTYTDLRTRFDFDDSALLALAAEHTDAVLFTDAADSDDSLNRCLLPTGFADPNAFADHNCDYCDQPFVPRRQPIVAHIDLYGPADIGHLACFQRAAKSDN